MIRPWLKRLAKKRGYLISKYDPARDPIEIRKSYLENSNISVVFDVGANIGQFAKQLRKTGYNRKIVSFEPLSSAYKLLEMAASSDPIWIVQQCAIGDMIGASEINISENSYSSSLLDMLKKHTQAAPNSTYIDKETIAVKTLDSIFNGYVNNGEQVFLKIDTQGYTEKVLNGAKEVISKISGVFVEMSLIPLYLGEPLIGDVISKLYNNGFVLVSIEPEFIDKANGQLLQVNGLFVRE